MIYLNFWKRIFDFIFAFTALFILIIPSFIIAIVIKIISGGPVLFSHERIGKGGKPFRILKFKTMKTQTDNYSSITVAGDERITPFGRFLRRWKLDEIPQLWNVLRGEMSIVGPRPDVPGYTDRLKGEAKLILRLRPGITGPSTLKYANEEEILANVEDPLRYNDEVIFPDKVKLNLKYIKNCSFLYDFFLVIKTMQTVLKRTIKEK